MIFKNNGFTSSGLLKYWKAIDSAIHFWNTRKNGTGTQLLQKGMSIPDVGVNPDNSSNKETNKSKDSQKAGTSNAEDLSLRSSYDRLPEFFRRIKQEELQRKESSTSPISDRRNVIQSSRGRYKTSATFNRGQDFTGTRIQETRNFVEIFQNYLHHQRMFARNFLAMKPN